MTRWRPALRMARRDLWRHKGRTALTMLLVALPVLVGVVAAQLHHNTRWEGERAARTTMGAADAVVQVTPFERARVTYWPGDMGFRSAAFDRSDSGERRPVRRDTSSVDLEALLPPGSRTTPALQYVDVGLATGGVGHVAVVDASDPMSEGLVAVADGAVPTGPDEVALGEAAADELGLLDAGGEPRSGATLELIDGTRLRVVGVLEANADLGYGADGVQLLAAPGGLLASRPSAGDPSERRYLVDLPSSVAAAPHALATSLAAQGVAMLPRDVFFHPEDWRVRAPSPGPVDPGSIAIGALVVLFGLIEVVLVVGSTFAVGARRQVRDLGLMAASGGAPADVRRVLLAQGLVLGVVASVVGAVAGAAAFRLGSPAYAQLTHRPIWSHELDWPAVLTVTVLGALTGLVAAFVPALSVGRLTPVAALAGRFPLRAGESRAHRPAFVLAGLGLLVLALAGWWISVEYAPPPQTPGGRERFSNPSTLPVVVGALGLLLLLGGVVWSAPYAVRRLAALGRWLPLAGRFAFRDAARHRFRTAAAAVTLMVTVAGAVFAAFVVEAAAAGMTADSGAHGHRMTIYLDEYEAARLADPDRVSKVVDTVHDVLGPAETLVAARVARGARGYSELGLRGGGRGYEPVRVVDESTLRRLVGDDSDVLQAFRDGAVVTTSAQRVDDGSVRVGFHRARGHESGQLWTLPAVVAAKAHVVGDDLFETWVSEQVVDRLGLVAVPTAVTVLAERAVTSEDIDRLAVHGINAWSPDTQLEVVHVLRLGFVVAAGVLTSLVVGMAVALSAAEGRADQATMAAVGAGPWRRRTLGAMHGLFLAVAGGLLGLVVGLPSGVALVQADGAPGIAVPWLEIAGLLVVVPLLGWGVGGLVTSTRLTLVRRTG